MIRAIYKQPAVDLGVELQIVSGCHEFTFEPEPVYIAFISATPKNHAGWTPDHVSSVFARAALPARTAKIAVSLTDRSASQPNFLHSYQDGTISLLSDNAFVFAADPTTHLYGGPDPQLVTLTPAQRQRCSDLVSALSSSHGAAVASWLPKAQSLSGIAAATHIFALIAASPSFQRSYPAETAHRLTQFVLEARHNALATHRLSRDQHRNFLQWEQESREPPPPNQIDVTRGTFPFT